jgi:hypothetical protein
LPLLCVDSFIHISILLFERGKAELILVFSQQKVNCKGEEQEESYEKDAHD